MLLFRPCDGIGFSGEALVPNIVWLHDKHLHEKHNAPLPQHSTLVEGAELGPINLPAASAQQSWPW